jgi:hypothetical protein
VINILAADKLLNAPRLYATFLLWMLSELFETLPEIGDPEKPKLVFFFDEAHLLFNDAPKVLVERIELVVRLVRSKGVGVYFVTQNPLDIPDSVLGQLGNRVQHALRAFTPRDQKAVKATAQTMRPKAGLDIEAAITELAVGEALVSFLDAKGRPCETERVFVLPPGSQIGPITAQRQALLQTSLVAGCTRKWWTAKAPTKCCRSHAASGALATAAFQPARRPPARHRAFRARTGREAQRGPGGGIGAMVNEMLFGRTGPRAGSTTGWCRPWPRPRPAAWPMAAADPARGAGRPAGWQAQMKRVRLRSVLALLGAGSWRVARRAPADLGVNGRLKAPSIQQRQQPGRCCTRPPATGLCASTRCPRATWTPGFDAGVGRRLQATPGVDLVEQPPTCAQRPQTRWLKYTDDLEFWAEPQRQRDRGAQRQPPRGLRRQPDAHRSVCARPTRNCPPPRTDQRQKARRCRAFCFGASEGRRRTSTCVAWPCPPSWAGAGCRA